MTRSVEKYPLTEVEGFMLAHEREPRHVTHVAQLALQLFDQLKPLHLLGDTERFLLQAAALLHDIGWEQSETGRKHHKIAARMIREHSWKNIPREWVDVIACIARYHRRAAPADHHRELNRLPVESRHRVSLLVPILRVADGLDRMHLCRVRHLRVTLEPGVIRLRVSGTADLGQEISAAMKKADAFKTAYHCALQITNTGSVKE